MDRKKELLWRAYLVMLFFVIATLVILFKVFKTSVFEREKWRQKGEVNVQWRTVDADRGNIYAEEQNLLSTSIQFFEVRMDMVVVKQDTFDKWVDSLAVFLSNFDKTFIKAKSKNEWKNDLIKAKKNNNRYFFIAKGLDIDAFNQLKKAPILRLGKYKGGLIKNRYGRRIKPFGDLASRTIGVDRENADKIGLEGYFDKFLKGPTDQRLMKRMSTSGDAQDVWLSVYDPSENQIVKGDDVYTTLNVEMQDILHFALKKALQKQRAAGGTAILMEVNTGKIKAISNLSRSKDSTYFEMYNHAIGRLFEPGSTAKLMTMLAAFDDGITNLDSLIDVNYGVRQFADRTMYDSEKHGKKFMTVAEAFELSSNVGIAQIANELYNSRDGRLKWYNRLQKFGLYETTGIDVAGEAEPYFKHPVKNKDEWYGTTIPWMAHGYEFLLTPLQVLNFYNSVANNGKMMKPYLVEELKNNNKTIKFFEPVVLNEKIAKDTSIFLAKKLLEGVVLNGTGKNIRSNSVSIAGKTGTAKVNYADKSQYPKYNASFCGYFPAEVPKYSLIVVVYEPSNGAYYGGAVAGPIFKEIAEKINAIKMKSYIDVASLPRMNEVFPSQTKGANIDFDRIFDHIGIKYDKKESGKFVKIHPNKGVFSSKVMSIESNKVPDVIGMGARDAVYLLEKSGMKVRTMGHGKVKRQSVPPGARIANKNIIIYLS